MRNSRNSAVSNNPKGPWTCDIINRTPVGTVAALSRGRSLLAVEINAPSPRAAVAAVRARFPGALIALGRSEAGRQLRQYFAGRRRSFSLEPLLDSLAPFYRSALEACLAVPYGCRATYGQLAAACGNRRAARAVGSALRRNPCPIVIPCHRIVAAAGLGGFSAPGGLRTKRVLLAFEAPQARHASPRR